MSHNYKLKDFNKPVHESETNLKELIVTICLCGKEDLPLCLEKRLEEIINILITEREQERNGNIPLEDMNMESYLNVNKADKELYIDVYIGYSDIEESIKAKEVVVATDKNYPIIKKYFFDTLKNHVSEQIKELEECLDVK